MEVVEVDGGGGRRWKWRSLVGEVVEVVEVDGGGWWWRWWRLVEVSDGGGLWRWWRLVVEVSKD